jgi:hypothetical protein
MGDAVIEIDGETAATGARLVAATGRGGAGVEPATAGRPIDPAGAGRPVGGALVIAAAPLDPATDRATTGLRVGASETDEVVDPGEGRGAGSGGAEAGEPASRGGPGSAAGSLDRGTRPRTEARAVPPVSS